MLIFSRRWRGLSAFHQKNYKNFKLSNKNNYMEVLQ